jgi:nucleoside-diphosphate-sugar epimerase
MKDLASQKLPMRKPSTKILVTGASGFLGARVVGLLIRKGYQVAAFSRRGAPDTLRHLPDDRIQWFTTNLVSDVLPWKSPALSDVAAVIHLAAVVDIEFEGIRANIEMSLNVLDGLPRWVHGFVLGSSCSVYAPSSNGRISESTPPSPQDGYGVAKLFQEGLFTTQAKRHGLSLFALRMCSLYGPGDPHGKAITKFTEAFLEGRVPTLRGNTRLRRDYLHIADAARAVILATEKLLAGTLGGVYNIGVGAGFSAREIVCMLGEIAGFNNLELPLPSEPDIDYYVFDTALANRELGFQAQISFADGLRDLMRELTPPTVGPIKLE